MEKLENDGSLRRFSLFWLWKVIVIVDGLQYDGNLTQTERHHCTSLVAS